MVKRGPFSSVQQNPVDLGIMFELVELYEFVYGRTYTKVM